MKLSELLEKHNLNYESFKKILDDLSQVTEFDSSNIVQDLNKIREKENQEDIKKETLKKLLCSA